MKFPWPEQQMLWYSAKIYELVHMRTDFGFGFQGIIESLGKAKSSGCSSLILLSVNHVTLCKLFPYIDWSVDLYSHLFLQTLACMNAKKETKLQQSCGSGPG